MAHTSNTCSHDACSRCPARVIASLMPGGDSTAGMSPSRALLVASQLAFSCSERLSSEIVETHRWKILRVVQTASTGHQSAGGRSGWCPELEVWAAHRARAVFGSSLLASPSPSIDRGKLAAERGEP